MKREALVALTTLLVAIPALSAQDTTAAQRRPPSAVAPAGGPLEQLVAEESQRRANIARVLLLTNAQVANQGEALKALSDQLFVDEQLVSSTRNQLMTASEALRRQPSTSLVVLFAADSASAAGIGSVVLSIDGANTATTSYSDTTKAALRVGAADEVFRGAVLPTPHSIVLTVVVNGQPQQLATRVKALGDATTYVQFAVQDGKLVQTFWANRGTNPF